MNHNATEHHQHSDSSHHDHHAMMIKDFKRRFWVSLVLSVPVLLMSPLIQRFTGLEMLAFTGQSTVAAVLSTAIFFYGGKPFLTGLRDEVKERSPGMMTLIGVAIGVAYIYSMAVVLGLRGEVFFWELATLIDVMLLGHWIEMRSVMGASRALDELAKLMPATAHKLIGKNKTKEVDVGKLNISDKVLVKPGEKIPADGKVVEGESSVNEAMITGESKPVSKSKGDSVIGGSLNQDGSLTVEVEKTGESSYLSQVLKMVQSAQASQSKTQNLAQRAAFWLTIVALTGGALTLGIWMAIGSDINFALSRMVTVMVITCPHALGLAIPLVVSRSTALTARNGLLIRDRNGFERARNIDTVVFDKTGTLTKGNFAVNNVVSVGKFSRDELLTLAASVESRSEHPLAVPIVAAAEVKKTSTDFQALPGKGVEGIVDGKNIKVVGPNYLREEKIDIENSELKHMQGVGATLVYVLVDGQISGAITLADEVRMESKSAILMLKERGIEPVMLTGDSTTVAKTVAKELGIETFFAEVLPDKKQEKIAELQKEGRQVAMVGDGVNDAPALAMADVGIAIGAGTDVAAETADIVLVNSDPRDVVKVLSFARLTYDKMKQNLWWASGYNILAIPLAAGALYSVGILLNPAAGAALMSLSTIVVAVNAQLLQLSAES